MKANMGSLDKTIRLVLGIVLLIAAYYFQSTLAYIGGIVGIVFIVTSLISRCPLYMPFGISTLRKK